MADAEVVSKIVKDLLDGIVVQSADEDDLQVPPHLRGWFDAIRVDSVPSVEPQTVMNKPASRHLASEALLARASSVSGKAINKATISADKFFKKAEATADRIDEVLIAVGDRLERVGEVAENLFFGYIHGVHTLSTIIVKRDVDSAKKHFLSAAQEVFSVLPEDIQGEVRQFKADYDKAGAGGRNAALAGIAAGAVAFTAAAFLAPGILMAIAPIAAMALAGAYMKVSDDRLTNATLEESARVPLKDSIVEGVRTGVTAGSAVFLGGIVFPLALPAGALALVGAGLGAGLGATLGYAGSEIGVEAARNTLDRMEKSPLLGMNFMSRMIRGGLNHCPVFKPA